MVFGPENGQDKTLCTGSRNTLKQFCKREKEHRVKWWDKISEMKEKDVRKQDRQRKWDSE